MLGCKYTIVHMDPSWVLEPLLYGKKITAVPPTLPETNPENRPGPKKKPSILKGELLVSGRVFGEAKCYDCWWLNQPI